MVTRVEKKDFAKYLVEARSWENDKVRNLEVSKRTAWIVALVASILAAISIVTVALLTPIQRVDAYVVKVDSGTGLVNVVKQLQNGDTNYDEAINKYFTQWYVRWREGFVQERAQEFYYNVGLMSAYAEQSRYLKQYDPGNSSSPLNIYKRGGRSQITIKSTVFDAPGAARVQFIKEEDWGGKDQKVSQWTAIIFYKFTGAPMSDKDREINPLGFQVINYTVSQDKPAENTPLAEVVTEPAVAAVNTLPSMAAPAAAPSPAAVVTVPAIAPISAIATQSVTTSPAISSVAGTTSTTKINE
jgi:type IV secretion system protein VirB8